MTSNSLFVFNELLKVLNLWQKQVQETINTINFSSPEITINDYQPFNEELPLIINEFYNNAQLDMSSEQIREIALNAIAKYSGWDGLDEVYNR